ncbi:MAG TPA: hypothetical protein VGO27_06385 [Candidatus Acidoferrum sp.]|jgi:KDO2-lipid IV(A) lauroyltransferase|nr:hypothetical protein [Candidatus Acidoferrum sp.]
MKEWAEYAVVRVLLKIIKVLPRQTARPLAASAAHVLFLLSLRLRETAGFNLRLAFPDWTEMQRAKVIRKMTRNLGWMAAEFTCLPKYAKQNIEDVVILDGHKIFLRGHQQGKGVLYLTGHIGAWELPSFAHALYGYPPHYMARPLDNRRLDQLVNRYPSLSGNRPIFKTNRRAQC